MESDLRNKNFVAVDFSNLVNVKGLLRTMPGSEVIHPVFIYHHPSDGSWFKVVIGIHKYNNIACGDSMVLLEICQEVYYKACIYDIYIHFPSRSYNGLPMYHDYFSLTSNDR